MREIALHILDIVTNSLEAEASRVIIAIEEREGRDLLRIRVRDNGRGMDADQAARATDPFHTTRETRSVGLGLSFFKQCALQAGGRFEIDSTPGRGTLVTAEFQLSHWNRPPLGEMADTVVNLMISNPEVHLAYYHKTDFGRFRFDSYWIFARAAQDGVAFYQLREKSTRRLGEMLKYIRSKA